MEKNRENEGNRENNRNTLEIYSSFERARARMETENIKILTERQQPRVVFLYLFFDQVCSGTNTFLNSKSIFF